MRRISGRYALSLKVHMFEACNELQNSGGERMQPHPLHLGIHGLYLG